MSNDKKEDNKNQVDDSKNQTKSTDIVNQQPAGDAFSDIGYTEPSKKPVVYHW